MKTAQASSRCLGRSLASTVIRTRVVDMVRTPSFALRRQPSWLAATATFHSLSSAGCSGNLPPARRYGGNFGVPPRCLRTMKLRRKARKKDQGKNAELATVRRKLVCLGATPRRSAAGSRLADLVVTAVGASSCPHRASLRRRNCFLEAPDSVLVNTIQYKSTIAQLLAFAGSLRGDLWHELRQPGVAASFIPRPCGRRFNRLRPVGQRRQ